MVSAGGSEPGDQTVPRPIRFGLGPPAVAAAVPPSRRFVRDTWDRRFGVEYLVTNVTVIRAFS